MKKNRSLYQTKAQLDKRLEELKLINQVEERKRLSLLSPREVKPTKSRKETKKEFDSKSVKEKLVPSSDQIEAREQVPNVKTKEIKDEEFYKNVKKTLAPSPEQQAARVTESTSLSPYQTEPQIEARLNELKQINQNDPEQKTKTPTRYQKMKLEKKIKEKRRLESNNRRLRRLGYIQDRNGKWGKDLKKESLDQFSAEQKTSRKKT